MTTHTYWASIGRDTTYGGTLCQYDWERFADRLATVIVTHGGEIVATVDGASQWQGQPEDTHLALFTIDGAEVSELRAHLAIVASRYHQEAIGLVGGPGVTLVYSA